MKKHFFQNRIIYDVGRAVKEAIEHSKTKKLFIEDKIIHDEPVRVAAPISKIFIKNGPKRINLVFSYFNKETIEKKNNQILLNDAIKFAKKNHFELRIITRNHLPNPKLFIDYLKKNNIAPPEKYSFYTDSSMRVSSPVYKLESSENDTYFTEEELGKMEEWINDEK